MTYVMDSERRANAAGFGPSRFRSKPCRNGGGSVPNSLGIYPRRCSHECPSDEGVEH